jgi:hypothetical protein
LPQVAGLREALAACRTVDTLVVTTLDRLARSIRGARDIVDGLTDNGVKLQIGSRVHGPDGPVAGCCSTSSQGSLTSGPASFAPEPATAWP